MSEVSVRICKRVRPLPCSWAATLRTQEKNRGEGRARRGKGPQLYIQSLRHSHKYTVHVQRQTCETCVGDVPCICDYA